MHPQKIIVWGVPPQVADKIDFKTNAPVRDNEEHYIMIMGAIQQEDIKLVNIHAPNTEAAKYVNGHVKYSWT